jgi:hypothetical protein
MNDQAFAATTQQTPRIILRVPLLDYSIGHEIILQRERNALLGDFETFIAMEQCDQAAAIMRGVQVCSRTWEQNKQPDKFIRLWARMIRLFEDLNSAIVKFHEYRMEAMAWPEVRPPPHQDDSARELGSSHLARMLDYASARFGQQAFDMPYGMVINMYFANAEIEGSCIVANEKELAIEREVGEFVKEVKEKRNGSCRN